MQCDRTNFMPGGFRTGKGASVPTVSPVDITEKYIFKEMATIQK